MTYGTRALIHVFTQEDLFRTPLKPGARTGAPKTRTKPDASTRYRSLRVSKPGSTRHPRSSQRPRPCLHRRAHSMFQCALCSRNGLFSPTRVL